MHLRQIALVAAELEPVVDDLQETFGLGAPFADEGVGLFGLHNAVFPIGSTYLEVVSPERPGTTAGRLLERRGGDGGYMAIFQTDDLDADRKRVESLGVRIVWETDLGDAATIHLHPRDVGAAIVSIDHMDPPESWRWAGPGWEERSRTDVSRAIVGATVQAADPDAMAGRWSEVLDAKRDGRELHLGDTRVRFVAAEDERGDGICAVDLAVADPDAIRQTAAARGLPTTEDTVEVCGVRFRLV